VLRNPTRTDVKQLARIVYESVMRPVRSLMDEIPGEPRRLLGTEVSAALHRRVEVTSALSFIPIAGLGRVFDADTTAKFSLSSHMNLSLGYRYLRVRAGEGPNFAELRLRGPVVGAGFRF
jgi:hypothetical protein